MKRADTFVWVGSRHFWLLVGLLILTLGGLLAGSGAHSPVSAAPDAHTIYTDRARFEASWNNWLREDFEEGRVKPAEFTVCGPQISWDTANDCFDRGDIVEPLILATDVREGNMVLLGGDARIGRTKAVGAERTGTAVRVQLKSEGVYAFGLEIWPALVEPSTARVSFLDSRGTAIDKREVRPERTGVFIGINADSRVQAIIIESDNPFVVDNITFAGDSLVCNGAGQGFENGLPQDWEVINNQAGNPVVWSDLAGCGEAENYTGGSGDAACASSDEHGGNSGLYDTELRSPSLDFSRQTFVHLDYIAKFASFAEQDVLDLDASTDGGATWENLLHWSEDHPTGSTHVVAGEEVGLNLSALAGQRNVRLRWRYYDPVGPIDHPDWFAQLDDLALTCDPSPDITVRKTVGTDPQACATTQAVEVPWGSEVTYCFLLANNGAEAVDNHTVFDSHLGLLLDGLSLSLDPGAALEFTKTAAITKTTVNTAWWSAETAGGVPTGNDDSATVTVTALDYDSCLDFESGALPPEVFAETFDSGGSLGRVAVSDAYPHTGSYALNLDTDCDACSAKTFQAATVVADLAGQTDVQLDFWVMGHDDEIDPDDAVVISDDGGESWAEIFSLAGRPARYENIVLDLDQAAADAGMNLVDGFLIRFQSFDNFHIPLDGYSFDDICLTPTRPKIRLETLVGTNANACGPWAEVAVPSGAEANVCYRVTNTGRLTLTQHTLQSNVHGDVLVDENFVLPPGATTWMTDTLPVNSETVVDADWFASDPGLVPEVSDASSALITVGGVPLMDVQPDAIIQIQPPDAVRQKSFVVSNPSDALLFWWLRYDIMAYGWSRFNSSDYRFVGFEMGSTNSFSTLAQVFPDYFDAGDFLGNDFDTLYAIQGDTNYIHAVDTESGAVTIVGPALPPEGYNHWVALSGHPDGDKFYGLGVFLSGGGYTAITGLFTIDPFSGEVELLTAVTPPDGTCCLGAMAVHPDTGVIYAAHAGVGFDAELVTIDPATGATTVIGSMGAEFRFPMAMDFNDATGQLYYVARRHTNGIDTEALYEVVTSNALTQNRGNLAEPLDILAIANGADYCQPEPGPPPWANPSAALGLVNPFQEATYQVTFDTYGLALGSYDGELCLDSNGFGADPIAIPLSLKVMEASFLPLVVR